MVAKIESNQNQEVVNAALEYGRARFHLKAAELKLRQHFPNLSDEELPLLCAVIENVASASLRHAISPATTKLYKGLSVVESKASKPKEVASSVLDAIIEVLGDKTMSVTEINEALKSHALYPKAKDPKGYINAVMTASRNKHYFKRVSRGVYCARKAKHKVAKKTKKEAPVSARVLRFLVSHGKPIASPDLAKKLGLPSAQALSPLLVSLRENGGVKATEKDGITLWQPIESKLRAYDADRGGAAFNGVATHG